MHTFSITELAYALVEKKAIIFSELGQKTVAIDHLLYFEPYAYVSPQILFSEEYSNKVISEAFMDEVNTSYTKVDQLRQVLSINSTKLRAALGGVPPSQQDQPEYQCKLIFQLWMDGTQNPTYGALRSVLKRYSVLCGRNPRVSVLCVDVWVFCCLCLCMHVC